MSALPGILARNWTLKLSAFGIALLLWVSVRIEAPDRQVLEEVPVRVDLGDPEWALLEDPVPATARIRLNGPSRELMSVALGERPTIVVPFDRVGSTDTTVALRTQYVRMQDRPGVVVEEIEPGSVRLAFEPVQRADLPVAVRLEGELPDEWALAGMPRPDPAEVRVSGPVSSVQEMDSVRLSPVPLEEIEESGRYGIAVDTAGTGGLQIQPAGVEVELVLEERVERTLNGVPVVMETPDWEDTWLLDPPMGTVELSGARGLVEDIAPGALRLVVVVENGDLPEDPGEEISVAPRLDGVPDLLRGEAVTERIVVRRRADPDVGGEGP